MVCAFLSSGFVTVKTTAGTTRTKPTAPTTRALRTSSLVEMATVCPAATYVMGTETVWTALMKIRGYVREPPPPRAPGLLSAAVMGLALT